MLKFVRVYKNGRQVIIHHFGLLKTSLENYSNGTRANHLPDFGSVSVLAFCLSDKPKAVCVLRHRL